MLLKRISILILFLFITSFSLLQAQNLISVYPQEYPNALKNPLKGFRDKADRNDRTNFSYSTIVREY